MSQRLHQGFRQAPGQPFQAQSSELGDVTARGLIVGVYNNPSPARVGLVYKFRGTANYGVYTRFFSLSGPQTVMFDLTPFENWSLQLLAAGSLALPPTDPPLAWCSTTPQAPDPARRDTPRLAVRYTANEIVEVPPGARRCWSASAVAVSINWTTTRFDGLQMTAIQNLPAGAETMPRGTNLQPTTALDLVWEIEL